MTARTSSLRPWIAALLLYGIVTVVVTHPLLWVAGSQVTRPIDDPLLNIWILWWNTHAVPLTHAWWNAPMFYPAPDTMAFSELLLGLLPITAPVQWISHNPVLAYNAAVLLSFPLCALAAHALAYELTGRHDVSILAGLAFAFGPIRANAIGNVQMLSFYWTPIVFLALHRYQRTRHWLWAALAAIAGVLQVLCNGYTLFFLPVMVGLWIVWFARTRRDVSIIAGAWLCGVVALLPILLKYRHVLGALHLQRSIGEIRMFSADIASLISAPPETILWGRLLTSSQAYGLFPGLTVVVILGTAIVFAIAHRARGEKYRLGWDRLALAAIALLAGTIAAVAAMTGPWTIGPISVDRPHKPLTWAIVAAGLFVLRGPWWRHVWRARTPIAFYALSAIACYVLAFGPEPRLWGARVFYKAPYAWLMELPGFDAIRAPNRFAMLSAFSIAILVALLVARWRPSRDRNSRLVVAGIAAGLLVDGWFRVSPLPVPAPGPGHFWPDVAAVVELPMKTETAAPALFRSIPTGLPLVNGVSGYVPPHYPALETALRQGDVDAIRQLSLTPIGVAIDRADPNHASIERAIAGLDSAVPLSSLAHWATFVVLPATQTPDIAGPPIPIARVSANRHADQISRATDGRLDTIWASDEQNGDEELTIDLDAVRSVGAVELSLGACTSGFPRDLAIDLSRDGATWTEAWRGRTAMLTLRAALDHPSEVPLRVHITPADASLIRLRQVGRDAQVPWCVAELAVRGPG